MKIVKTRLRNKIEDQWMNDCLVTYIEKEVFQSVENESILNRFQDMEIRRFQLPKKRRSYPAYAFHSLANEAGFLLSHSCDFRSVTIPIFAKGAFDDAKVKPVWMKNVMYGITFKDTK
ncbi:hypothetical protein LXL04_019154 [Taraxacum kok-saghyz]